MRSPPQLDSRGVRGEEIIETDLRYRPGEPVLVTVTRRDRRVSVTDGGAAAVKAGLPPRWRPLGERIARELDVNISRRGAVSLPVVPAGPALEEIVRRIGEASLTLYEELLELQA